ncbi:MAG: bifunctional enoyl-CoA hydratase/phosphate acetyltransferase [Candidatus Cloacimonetes bacterium]|nr:bifunctional enoyl-CoA hydratase/phosphate acetyltransferase [Candidatus Cloacimonadota bacterium]
MQIKSLKEIITLARERPHKRVVVAYGQDTHTLNAVSQAVDMGIVDATIVGDKAEIEKICGEINCDPSKFEIIHEPNEAASGYASVALVNAGKADLIMKGLISTDKYMRALIHKESGLMNPGAILTHVAVVESPNYHKLLVIGDVAIIPKPDLKQKIIIAQGLINAAISIGVEKPKLAVITATEKANPKMRSCVDAAILSKMSERGQIKGGIIDGPLALDTAIDMDSVRVKKIRSEVAGDADCLLFSDIESGNVFYKTVTKIARAELAAVVTGARKPAILSSRGDNTQTKLYSLALGALMAE